MGAESTLIESGINLLLTGMIVVFFFLVVLIISIYLLQLFFYLLQLFFSESSNNRSSLASNPNADGPINKIHERIINEVMEHRQT